MRRQWIHKIIKPKGSFESYNIEIYEFFIWGIPLTLVFALGSLGKPILQGYRQYYLRCLV